MNILRAAEEFQCGCLGSSFDNVYCEGLMQRFTEIEILIFSYIAAPLAS
jgi:hypothetical protein